MCIQLRAMLAALEPRVLFDTLVVDGTPGNDSIALLVQKEVITLTVNGSQSFFADDLYDAIDVRGLGGDDAIVIQSSGDNDIFVRGDNADGSGTGNDAIEIGEGNLDAVPAPVVVTAGGGTDLVRLHDQNNNFSDSFVVRNTNAQRLFFGGAFYGTDLESLVVNNSGGGNTIQVLSTSPATLVSINGGGGVDTLNVVETDPASPIVVQPDGAEIVNVNPDDAGFAAARFDDTSRIFRLSIGAGGRATIAPHGAHVLSMVQLFITAGGTFDINNNAAVIDYNSGSPVAQVQADLASGYNAGAWNGTGITSSTAAAQANTAVGYAEATDLFGTFPATFAGVEVDNTAVLLRHTFYGDADLNRTVNLADFNRLAANFGQSNRRWSQGDFDFNGTVNLGDFNRLAASFGSSA